jgi:OmpA-OmpF porin, OOP family
MRATLIRGIIIVGLAASLPLSVHAQSSQDLLQSLQLPKGSSGTSRGIHAVPGTGDTGSAPTATPSTGGSAPSTAHTHRQTATAAPVAGGPSSGEANIYVEFRTGSAELSPAAMRILNSLGTALTSPQLAGDRFRIEGHTDTVGSPETNKSLSEQRAAAVVDFLVNTYHLDRSRFDTVGLGETDLLVQTPPQTPQARNRRVRVVNLGA